MTDEYPTEEELQEIREANSFQLGLSGMVDLIRDVWSDYGKLEFDGKELFLATGGWSGNEDVISALQDNLSFWAQFWRKSERGGAFTFQR